MASQPAHSKVQDVLNFDSIADLKYYNNCFMESLRIEPPVMYSSHVTLTEDTKIGDYTILGGDIIHINMFDVHNNKEEWIDPHKYIPDRFDP